MKIESHATLCYYPLDDVTQSDHFEVVRSAGEKIVRIHESSTRQQVCIICLISLMKFKRDFVRVALYRNFCLQHLNMK